MDVGQGCSLFRDLRFFVAGFGDDDLIEQAFGIPALKIIFSSKSNTSERSPLLKFGLWQERDFCFRTGTRSLAKSTAAPAGRGAMAAMIIDRRRELMRRTYKMGIIQWTVGEPS